MWKSLSNIEPEPPRELAPLVDWFYSEDESRERFRWALRDGLDELLDGQRTGRWAYQHLSPTEKAHLGTVVEINLTKEFDLESGELLDWQIRGIELDCKYSQTLGNWEIPLEMYRCDDHGDRQGRSDFPALLTWLSDDSSEWAAGLITVTDKRLRWMTDKTTGAWRRVYNADRKRRLSDAAAKDIFWLWGGRQSDLPRNLLLHMSPEARARVFANARSGQARVNQLFREVQQQLIGRQTVLTVAQQDDAPKRARDARPHLRPDGMLVIGHELAHQRVARELGLPAPAKGEWISVRVVPVNEADTRKFTVLDGKRWAKARNDDPPTPAPLLPRTL
ncbi:restriction endonuclease NaeI [Microbacterium sp. BK668]|nr:restriction endonuclease NaeI [Microbacterium sp. BK668]